MSVYPVESEGDMHGAGLQNIQKAALKIIPKDGLNILTILPPMWQAMLAEWNIRVLFFAVTEQKDAGLLGCN